MKTKEEMTFELCSQLHEQYAIADNKKTNSVIYFILVGNKKLIIRYFLMLNILLQRIPRNLIFLHQINLLN